MREDTVGYPDTVDTIEDDGHSVGYRDRLDTAEDDSDTLEDLDTVDAIEDDGDTVLLGYGDLESDADPELLPLSDTLPLVEPLDELLLVSLRDGVNENVPVQEYGI